MPYVRANPSTQQTNTNLVASVSNKGVYIEKIYISSDTELTITLSNATAHDVLWRQYVGARGGQWADVDMLSAWHEGLDYSTSGAGNVFIAVKYQYRGAG